MKIISVLIKDILNTISEVLNNITYQIIISILVIVIGVIKIEYSIKITDSNEVIPIIFFLLKISLVYVIQLLFIISFFRIIGRFCFILSEMIPNAIEIIPMSDPEFKKLFDYEKKEIIITNYANLKIVNHENFQITDCYAILNFVHDFNLNGKDLQGAENLLIHDQSYLVWKDNIVETNYVTIIPPYGGYAILHVYQLEYRLKMNEKDDTPSIILSKASGNFSCYDDRRKIYKILDNDNNSNKTEIEIEFHGKYGNKDILIKKFSGYIETRPINKPFDKTVIKICKGKLKT